VISPTEASARILAAISPLEMESVPLSQALGRYAAGPVLATRPLPSCDFSAMDGYAIHAADCGGTPSLDVTGEHAAGSATMLTVQPGHAIRIFTGAPIPQQTGAVIMQEDVDATSHPPRIQVREPAVLGEFIRRAGADVCPGQILLPQGERCHAGHLGLLAAQGMPTVNVVRRPTVGILTTGSELIPPGTEPTHAGQIFNSNGPLLQALLQQHQLADSITLAHAPDDLPMLQQTMEQLLASVSVLICIGGVSVGDHDLVKPALTNLGVSTDFWRVAMKPGKPFLFGQQGRKFIFGLPGNPVSAYVTAFLLVLPALRKLAGAAHPAPPLTRAILGSAMENRDARQTYFRGRWVPADGKFSPLGLQESHALYGLSQANALLAIPPHTKLEAGSAVEILLL
jgi:molybdopterin molybdotransferase